MTGGCTWEDLDGELLCWRGGGAAATLWWRDDDACAATPALERLAELSQRWQVPLALAAVPARLDASLAGVWRDGDVPAILQHGYAHRDYARPDEPAAELGDHRPPREVLAELASGRERLEASFAERFVPVLVPPWNRIAPGLLPRLGELGFRGLSRFAARERRQLADGVLQANCHVDPVDWRRGAAFRGEERCLAALCAHLRARREGRADRDEPTGLLTHHLVHGPAVWSFLDRLFAALAGRPEVRWLHSRQVFAA